MIQLFANGHQLDASRVSFNLNRKSPIFREKLEGDYVFNINLPGTDRNNQIFGFPVRIEKYNTINVSNFKIIADGIEVVPDSTIEVTKTQNGTITGNICIGIGDIIYQLQDKYLKDIDLGGSRVLCGEAFVPTDYYNNTGAGEYPDFDFVLFPVYNEEFYDGTDQEATWRSGTKIVNNYTSGFETGDPHTLVPFPYVAYLIDRIFREYGYSIVDNAFTNHADLIKLVLYNNYADIVTVVVEDPGPPITFSYTSKANHRINLQNQVPEYKVLDMLNDLRFLGLAFFVDPYNKKVKILFLKDILNNPSYKDITSSVIQIKSKENLPTFNGFKFAYSLENDSWGDTYFKNELTKYLLKDPVATTLDLPIDETTEVNEVRLVTEIDTYYIFRWDEDSSIFTWVYFAYHYEDINQEQKNNLSITPGCCPLFVEQLIVGTDPVRVRLLPKIGQPGTNKFFVFNDTKELFVNEPGKRFCFYRGLQHDSLSGSYPLGTPDVYDLAGEKIEDANLSLKWDGEYGLYNQLWKPVIEEFALKTKLVEIEKMFTASELKNFDFSKKYRVNGIDYLVKELKASFSNGTITATMTCYKV